MLEVTSSVKVKNAILTNHEQLVVMFTEISTSRHLIGKTMISREVVNMCLYNHVNLPTSLSLL